MIETGNFVHTTLAHPNNVYEVLEVGKGWLLVDDNTVAKLSIPTDSATIHAYCGDKWCHACHTSKYDGLAGDIVFYVRKTGEKFQDQATEKLSKLSKILDEYGIDKNELLKGVEPGDDKTLSALLFFAERINPNVTVL